MRLPFVSLFAVFVLSLTTIAAAAPVNDSRGRAIVLPTANQISSRGNNVGATFETVDRTYYSANRNVWYKWTAPCSGATELNVIGGYDCTVALFALQEDGSLAFRGYDDDSGDGLNSKLEFTAVGGTTYYIAVDGFGTARSQGYFLLTIALKDVLADNFGNSRTFVTNNFIAVGSNASFTLETGEPLHGIAPNREGKSAWISWTAESRSRVTIDTKNSQFDTLLAVYTGDTLDTLQAVAKNDDISSSEPRSEVTFIAESGQTFHIAVAGKNDTGNLARINFTSAKIGPGVKVASRNVVVYNGDSAALSATASVTGDSTYQWEIFGADKRWTPVPDDTNYSGATTANLSIATTDLSMNGTLFRLVVSDEVSTTRSGSIKLTVTEFPAVATEVLGTVEVNLSNGNVPPPEEGGVYFAKGLPKGLTLDPETGVVSGTITAKPGTYLVTYGSANGKVRNPEQYVLQIIVAPFSSYLTGSFEALMDSATAPGLPAGKLAIKVAGTGAFTGSYFVLSEGKAYSFRGTVALDQATRTAGVGEESPVMISRGKKALPLALSFTLSEPAPGGVDSFASMTASIWDANDDLVASASNGEAVARFSNTTPAPWGGSYTVRLSDFAPTPDRPFGAGYATATIAANTGVIGLRGRLADNTPFTANLASSPDGTYRLAQKVHAVGGSLAGLVNLAEQLTDDQVVLNYHVDAATGSTLYWTKPPRPKDKLYPAGFGPVALTFLMEPWQNPAGDFPGALGLAADGDMKVNIVAKESQDSNDALTIQANHYGLPIDVRIGANGGLSFVSPATNATKFTLKVNASTGAFTGSYQLAETEVVPPAKKPIMRKVNFSGVFFQLNTVYLNDVIGEGFAIVPPFPNGSETTSSALIQFLAGETESLFKFE